MVKLEIKKNLCSIYFAISVLICYLTFMSGDGGHVLPGGSSTTVFGAVWNKLHGNWQRCEESSYLIRMYYMWEGNEYLSVLMPFICGLPGVAFYLEEIKTGNKKLILSRCGMKKYYCSKIVANIITAAAISLAAVFCYYATLFIFYDGIAKTEDAFSVVCFVFLGELPDSADKISMAAIYLQMIKGVVYFSLYSVMGSSFCLMMAVWCRDKYVTFGSTIFLCYLQWRIVMELLEKHMDNGWETAGKLFYILNPIFLHYAGRAGFYENKEWLAVTVAIVWIIFNFYMYMHISERLPDVSEG